MKKLKKNIAAKSLRNPLFRMKIVTSKKIYNRKKSERVLTEYTK